MTMDNDTAERIAVEGVSVICVPPDGERAESGKRLLRIVEPWCEGTYGEDEYKVMKELGGGLRIDYRDRAYRLPLDEFLACALEAIDAAIAKEGNNDNAQR